MRTGLLAIALLAASAASAAAATAPTHLSIRFRAEAASAVRHLTLHCAARATGTVPRPAAACARLQRLGDGAFRPTPPQTACTEISGGPSTATITGIYRGRTIWVRLRRDNGCEIARWQRVAFLLPRPAPPR